MQGGDCCLLHRGQYYTEATLNAFRSVTALRTNLSRNQMRGSSRQCGASVCKSQGLLCLGRSVI